MVASFSIVFVLRRIFVSLYRGYHGPHDYHGTGLRHGYLRRPRFPLCRFGGASSEVNQQQKILAVFDRYNFVDSNLGPTDYERVLGSDGSQPKPTNSKRSLAYTKTGFGLSCRLSAVVLGEKSESSRRGRMETHPYKNTVATVAVVVALRMPTRVPWRTVLRHTGPFLVDALRSLALSSIC